MVGKTRCGVALEKVHFTNEKTKVPIGNIDLALPFCKTCPFPSETECQ